MAVLVFAFLLSVTTLLPYRRLKQLLGLECLSADKGGDWIGHGRTGADSNASLRDTCTHWMCNQPLLSCPVVNHSAACCFGLTLVLQRCNWADACLLKIVGGVTSLRASPFLLLTTATLGARSLCSLLLYPPSICRFEAV